MTTIFWWLDVVDIFNILVAASLCWLPFSLWKGFFKESVTNISTLSPTEKVSNIRHQNRSNHFSQIVKSLVVAFVLKSVAWFHWLDRKSGLDLISLMVQILRSRFFLVRSVVYFYFRFGAAQATEPKNQNWSQVR